MTHEEFEMIRIVIGYRLIARKVSHIAQVQRISEAAVKRILLEHGEVPRRGRGYYWSGPYSISEAKHKWLAFPDYIPLHIAGVSFQITNQPAWMGITRDDIYIRRADGSLRSWGDGKSQPFHKADGAQYETPLPDTC